MQPPMEYALKNGWISVCPMPDRAICLQTTIIKGIPKRYEIHKDDGTERHGLFNISVNEEELFEQSFPAVETHEIFNMCSFCQYKWNSFERPREKHIPSHCTQCGARFTTVSRQAWVSARKNVLVFKDDYEMMYKKDTVKNKVYAFLIHRKLIFNKLTKTFGDKQVSKIIYSARISKTGKLCLTYLETTPKGNRNRFQRKKSGKIMYAASEVGESGMIVAGKALKKRTLRNVTLKGPETEHYPHLAEFFKAVGEQFNLKRQYCWAGYLVMQAEKIFAGTHISSDWIGETLYNTKSDIAPSFSSSQIAYDYLAAYRKIKINNLNSIARLYCKKELRKPSVVKYIGHHLSDGKALSVLIGSSYLKDVNCLMRLVETIDPGKHFNVFSYARTSIVSFEKRTYEPIIDHAPIYNDFLEYLIKRYGEPLFVKGFAQWINSTTDAGMYFDDTCRMHNRLSTRFKAVYDQHMDWSGGANIKTLHDRMQDLNSRLSNPKIIYVNEPWMYSKKGEWEIRPPVDSLELVSWGKELHNCLGSYTERHNGYDNFILGVFKKDKLVAASQIVSDYSEFKLGTAGVKGKLSIQQLYEASNHRSDDSTLLNVFAEYCMNKGIRSASWVPDLSHLHSVLPVKRPTAQEYTLRHQYDANFLSLPAGV